MDIGFIGQGWIGKHYADDFENRGFSVVRYGLEAAYIGNKKRIAGCDIVFIAVPTPTTPEGFDDSIVREAMGLVGEGKIAVIKSTIAPGTTESIQAEHPGVFAMHSPEFLVEKTAAYDAAHPNRNIIGIPVENKEYRAKAETVMEVLPAAPYQKIMAARDAEFVKYAGNCFLYVKVMYMNLLYDLVEKEGGSFADVREGLINDPRIGESHTTPVFDGGRGAGGHCFIKDFEAFRRQYEELGDARGDAMLRALAEKNIELLVRSGKDREILEGVYGNVERYE